MPDTKITALTAITTVDPAVDVLPIVDVSDTTMAASGTTKKITSNQILGAGGTATLASATITGDLTVDTSTLKVDSANNRVGIGTATPQQTLDVSGTINSTQARFGNVNGRGLTIATALVAGVNEAGSVFNALGSGSGAHVFQVDSVEQYRIAPLGVFTWSDGAGGTRMTLNSTGLAIGGSAFSNSRLTLVSSASNDCLFSLQKSGTARTAAVKTDGTNLYLSSDSGATGNKISLSLTAPDSSLSIDSSGNVGVGVTPSAWNASFRGIDISTGGAIAGSSDSVRLFSNSAFNTAGNNVYKNTATAGRYDIQGNVHTWSIAPSGTAGNTITFTSAMTLSAAGSLVLGSAAVATTATDGFLYIPGCAGTPTGTPTAQTGRVPLVVDTTNNKLYFYSGGSWVAAN